MTIDFSKFCRSEKTGRLDLSAPWTRGDYTYATNGHILIRMPQVDGIGDREKTPDVAKQFETYMQGRERATRVPQAPAYDFTDCDDCGGTGKIILCSACEGEGSQLCDLGHEHECEECDGVGAEAFDPAQDNGAHASDCATCEGRGKIIDLPFAEATGVVLDDGTAVGIGYLICLNELADAVWTLDGRSGDTPIPFWFEGGEGLLMPMRTGPGYDGNYIRLNAEAAA